MKSERTGLLLLVGAMLALAPGQIEAQTYIALERVSISATGYQQGSTSSNATTSTTKPPVKFSITTGKLLEQLVADEFSYGNRQFTSAVVPRGAVLNFNGSGFEIDQGTNQLADVSADGILAWSVSGQNDINTGSFLNANGQGTPPYNQTDYYLATVTYASPPSSFNSLFFTLTGLATVTGRATNPIARTGNYTLFGSVSFSDGTGEGENPDGPFVLTGFTMTASGSVKANNGQGTDQAVH
jgi:hypothetical protein